VDTEFLDLLVPGLAAAVGLPVLPIGDTEATKTTGLVQRLLNEGAGSRADVFWSSEPLGVVRLAAAGLLAEPSLPLAVTAEFGSAWPAEHTLRTTASMPPVAQAFAFAFAHRARVLAFRTDHLSAARLTFDSLLDPALAGRIGLARPAFGTTRAHFAALHHALGPDGFAAWATALVANRPRQYDGNAAVVRALAQGEIHLGLTDSDDVFAGQRNRWPVDMVLHGRPEALPIPHCLMIPNTIAVLRAAPNPQAASALLAAVLTGPVESALAASASGNVPVRPSAVPAVRGDGGPVFNPDRAQRWHPDWSTIADHAEPALRAWAKATGEHP
jgi:iron(III) transport system substrate-binding protein